MNTPESKTVKASPHWLLSPWAILAGVVLGCVIGIKYKSLAEYLTIPADIFLALIQMCVIPIIVTAVISSLSRLVARRVSGRFLSRLAVVFISGLIFASLVGLVAGVLGRPGENLDESARARIGQMILKYEVEATNKDSAESGQLSVFLKGMVPANVFKAFSQGQMLAILFFCIAFGIALGFVRTSAARVTSLVMEALYEAFQKLFSWVMYVLPFGLCVLFASQVSHMGLTIFKTLIKFIGVFYLTAFFLFVFYNTLIWWRRGGGYFQPVIALRETFLVALGTSSSYATMPSAMRCLREKLNVDKTTANLVIPLGVSVHPQGKVMYFVLATILIAQVYNVSLGFQGIMIALIGSIFAAMGATGIPGPATLSILAVVLTPLGLPAQTAVILLMAIDPLTNPVLTVVNIFGNCTATVLAEERPAVR
ncbi:MAG: dicarboxylate/amino acid:cation symporter [Candidatus Omnitrophica bacterium]|nr:dicarboxylate/amino acid:cation symporter [Candidatus Omnitrophota bacterium]